MYPIDTQDGLFHDGDGISELGTILPASWLNQIQQELIAVLSEAGIIPEKANTNQVVNAIKLIISNGRAKFATQATRLQTARTINGVPFDGTQDINATPAGTVMYFAREWAPTGWLKANGAAVSRTAYPGLFAVLGTLYGAGDGSTTFNLPDLRGEFIRSYDDRRGVDPGRWIGNWQGDAIRNITGRINVVRRGGEESMVQEGALYHSSYSNVMVKIGENDNWGAVIGFDAGRAVPTANENRPRNIVLLACIKI
ncbi:phage tail protein [Snodgrassella communis]|uniref:phage tail protein n=1 Tax=Snodgrassella communis TaxID=2946699 RepID=UPI001EF617B9|nr:phage tail protein [Snodgrassella communis]